MPTHCFIGIDQGSSATKAAVISEKGQVLFQTRKDLPPPYREGPRVEQDPLAILDSALQALNEAAAAARAAGARVLGIGLSCQRSSCMLWNEMTGEPLSPVLSWRDTRGAGLVESVSMHRDAVFEATGLPLTPYYSASKFRWLADNDSAARQDSTVFGTLSSFLIQRLTRSDHAVIDHTHAARTQLMNIHGRAWDADVMRLFGLSDIRLPEITPTARDFGVIKTTDGEAPLLASLGDQQAAMLGLGVLERGDGGINYGTGGFLMVNTGSELTPAKGLMASVHYSMDNEQRYLLEGSVNAVGDALEWLRTRLGLFQEYAEVDDLCWKAATDVIVFTGLNGTGAPHWEADISSSIHGMTNGSASADIVRGTVEGIAFFMQDIAEEIRKAGIEPASFVVSGGLSSLSYLVQFQADVLGTNITVGSQQEVSALGAAFLAGMRHGTWTVADIKRMTAGGETVNGERNPGAERRYRRWKELHRLTRELDRL